MQNSLTIMVLLYLITFIHCFKLGSYHLVQISEPLPPKNAKSQNL